MSPITRRAWRAVAAAGLAASLITAIALVPSRAAQTAPTTVAPAQDEMAQRFAKHLQAHLDQLAERLEIKASQEATWQGFSAAFREAMSAGLADRVRATTASADADAAALARRQAERAEEHAQRLARLADATAKLQQSLRGPAPGIERGRTTLRPSAVRPRPNGRPWL